MKLELTNLSFRYTTSGPLVLDSLSFNLEPGSYWCLAGPNGSGKSTFLKIAAGLFSPSNLKAGLTGSLTWNSVPIPNWVAVEERLKLARSVAFVPGSLTPRFSVTVEEFVLQGRYPHSQFWSLPSTQDRSIVHEALERIGLMHLAKKLLTEVSSGELQLTALARAIAQRPSVLMLDEATASLDLAFQERIFSLLADLNRTGMTILIVSHDLNLAAEFCPNVLWLSKGRAHAAGSMRDTMTSEILHTLYGAEIHIEVGKNPFTGQPKIFWK